METGRGIPGVCAAGAANENAGARVLFIYNCSRPWARALRVLALAIAAWNTTTPEGYDDTVHSAAMQRTVGSYNAMILCAILLKYMHAWDI